MLKKILIGFVALIIIALIVLYFTFDSIVSGAVKYAINTYGPQATQTDVSVEGVSISPFSGNGTITDLKVGNPSDFQPPADAFTLGEISLDIDPGSLRTDTIVVNEIKIVDAEFNYNQGLGGSNLQTILDNVKKFSGASEKPVQPAEPAEPAAEEPAGEGKQLIIHRITVTGATAKATVMGQSVDVKLKDINIQGDPDKGITADQVVDLVLGDVLEQLIPQMTEEIQNIIKDPEAFGLDLLKGTGQEGEGGAKDVVDAVKNLF